MGILVDIETMRQMRGYNTDSAFSVMIIIVLYIVLAYVRLPIVKALNAASRAPLESIEFIVVSSCLQNSYRTQTTVPVVNTNRSHRNFVYVAEIVDAAEGVGVNELYRWNSTFCVRKTLFRSKSSLQHNVTP